MSAVEVVVRAGHFYIPIGDAAQACGEEGDQLPAYWYRSQELYRFSEVRGVALRRFPNWESLFLLRLQYEFLRCGGANYALPKIQKLRIG